MGSQLTIPFVSNKYYSQSKIIDSLFIAYEQDTLKKPENQHVLTLVPVARGFLSRAQHTSANFAVHRVILLKLKSKLIS